MTPETTPRNPEPTSEAPVPSHKAPFSWQRHCPDLPSKIATVTALLLLILALFFFYRDDLLTAQFCISVSFSALFALRYLAFKSDSSNAEEPGTDKTIEVRRRCLPSALGRAFTMLLITALLSIPFLQEKFWLSFYDLGIALMVLAPAKFEVCWQRLILTLASILNVSILEPHGVDKNTTSTSPQIPPFKRVLIAQTEYSLLLCRAAAFRSLFFCLLLPSGTIYAFLHENFFKIFNEDNSYLYTVDSAALALVPFFSFLALRKTALLSPLTVWILALLRSASFIGLTIACYYFFRLPALAIMLIVAVLWLLRRYYICKNEYG